MPDEILTVQEYVRRMNDGVTRPFLCRCNDNNQYVIKGQPNLNRKELIAEFIAASLATKLGLPCPPFRIAEVPKELLEFLPDLQGQLSPGLTFATAYIDGVSTISYIQSRSYIDIQEQKKIFFFDKWINNSDRSLTPLGGNVNLLLDSRNNRYYLIDHNLAFDHDAHESEFDVHVFSQTQRPWTYDLVDRLEFERLASAALLTLDEDFAAIPLDWHLDDVNEHDDFIASIRTHLERVNQPNFWSTIL